MSISSARKSTSGIKRPRSNSKSSGRASSRSVSKILADDNSESEHEVINTEVHAYDEDQDPVEEDGEDAVQISAQDLVDYPILHPAYRDSISHVIQFMKRQNGGVIYNLDYRSEFERCVNAYKASNDPNFIDQLFDYISMVCYDRVQKMSTMRGNSNSFLIYLCI